MFCPACGHQQKEGFECTECGVVFAKWAEHQARRRDAATGVPVRGARRTLGPSSRVVRALAGTGALALALLMYLNGAALRSLGPYVGMVLFGAAGLYLLVSVRERVTMGRLAAEALVLVLASAGLYVALPEVFSLRKPLYEEAFREPLPDQARSFLVVARAYSDGITRFLDTTQVLDGADARDLMKATDADLDLVPAFDALADGDQSLLRPAYLRLRSLDPLLAQLGDRMRREIPSGPAVWMPAALVADVRSQLAKAAADLAAAEADVARREATLKAGNTGTGKAE
jgi:hypothetical protein